jgi:hypothetical protein
MTEIKKQIIGIMEEWDNEQYECIWKGYNTLIDDIFEKFNIFYAKKELQKVMKELKKHGIIQYSRTCDPDFGILSGSGYFLTDNYDQILRRLED